MTKNMLIGRAPRLAVRVLSGTLLALVSLTGSASAQPTVGERAETQSGRHDVNPALFNKNSHPYGRSMETWSEKWWEWLMSVPATNNPNLSLSGDCGAGQSGPVFYLPASLLGAKGVIHTCTVEYGKAVALNLSSVFNDYPCPDPSFHPAPGQSLFDFLLAGAVEANGDIVTLETTLDGVPLQDLLSYHFASDDLFYFRGDLSLQSTFDSCLTGSLQPAAVDSYFVIFKPLPPGLHAITRRVVNAKGVVSGPNTVNLEVLQAQ
jgi:hypothetical protein